MMGERTSQDKAEVLASKRVVEIFLTFKQLFLSVTCFII